jgi:hypothetical protein
MNSSANLIQLSAPLLLLFVTESIECVRRLTLASVVGLADEDSPAGAAMGLLVSLLFVAVFSHLRPFKAEDDCTLGIVLSYSITLVSENFDPLFLPCYLGLIFFRSMHFFLVFFV